MSWDAGLWDNAVWDTTEGDSSMFYYYKKKKVKPDPLPQPVFSEVDWTVGKYSQQEQERKKQALLEQQKEQDLVNLKKLKDSLK